MNQRGMPLVTLATAALIATGMGLSMGIVAQAQNAPAKETKPPATLPPSTAITRAQGEAIVKEALKWRGIPRYVWGGNNIQTGIDTSHFVATVYSRAGVPCPDPPVHSMEMTGDIVHWKAGIAEEDFQLRTFPATAPLSNLQPGDRLIFQTNPAARRDGNHHTAIYIGHYGKLNDAIIHCNAGARTVTVNSLQQLWRIYRYAVRGNRPRKPGAWRQSASTEESASSSASHAEKSRP